MSTTEAPTQVMTPQATPRPVENHGLSFEAEVVREAALACRMAREHNCTIEVHIGGRWGKRPVDVRIHPHGPMSVTMADGKMERIEMGGDDGSELHH